MTKQERKVYTREWFRNHKEFNAMKSREWHKLHPEKTKFFQFKRRSRLTGMPLIMTREQFSDWYLKAEKKCTYCDLIDLSLEGKLSSGKTLLFFTIDRKDSSLPYSIENICFCCWTCNRLKSNVFSHEEWLEIGQKYIKPKWMKKLELVHK